MLIFNKLIMKKLKKPGVGMTNYSYWRKYSPDGSTQWLLVKPWTSSIGQCTRYCTIAPPKPSKWPAKWVHFFIVLAFPVALVAAGTIRSK
jgi:hypothetical protein